MDIGYGPLLSCVKVVSRYLPTEVGGYLPKCLGVGHHHTAEYQTKISSSDHAQHI